MSETATSTSAFSSYTGNLSVSAAPMNNGYPQSAMMNGYSQFANGASFVGNFTNQPTVAVGQPSVAPISNNQPPLPPGQIPPSVLSMVPQHQLAASLPPSTARSHIIDAPGLKSIWSACSALYPKQTDPLQVSSVTKFWLGGPDPLDFISMYANQGCPEKEIAPHWHYVSFGLSDLYGDGRVHPVRREASQMSGFGFELTFRLKREPDEPSPPTWPAAVMQSLAKYVFTSGNNLCPGDHVSWHCSLDNSDSRIQHMLMTEDPQLGTIMTPHGSVTFIQIVGVAFEELQAAQQWNGAALIDIMKGVKAAGGEWLVTDMRRGETIFEIDPENRDAVEDGIAVSGSDLSGVTAKIFWSGKVPAPLATSRGDDEDEEDEDENSEEKGNLKKRHKQPTSGLNYVDETASPILSTGHQDMEEGDRTTLSPTALSNNNNNVSSRSASRAQSSMSIEQVTRSISAASTSVAEAIELSGIKYLPCVHLLMNLEAGNILVLALRGRLKHKRHFTFKTVTNNLAVTLLTESVSGSYVSLESPYAIHGPWLQVLIANDYVDEMLTKLSESIGQLEQNNLPKRFSWAEKKLYVTILPDTAANAAINVTPAEFN